MLSIGIMSGGQCTYYLDLAQEDYYLEGGEPKGVWWGSGVQKLGVKGKVERDELKLLFSGYDPRKIPGKDERSYKKGLVQNAGKENRQPGWDLTFNAPKSVSVLWSQATPEVRQEIQKAHNEAVKAGLSYLEQAASYSRKGKGGATRERAGLVVATFEHGTSRALDPHLHTHCLVLNLGVTPDGKTRAIISKPFFNYKMSCGALYRTQLAAELGRRLGLEVEARNSWFELKGVPEKLIESFSKRRVQIQEKLKEVGLETASAAAWANLKTREVKKVVPPRNELFSEWRTETIGREFSEKDILKLLGKEITCDRTSSYNMALDQAVKKITQSKNHFTEKELVKYAAQATQAFYLDASYLLGWIKRDLENSERFVNLGERGGEVCYTTREVLTHEEKLIESAKRSQCTRTHILNKEKVKKVILKNTLDDEQALALRHLTLSKGSIKILSGIAGSGKTHTLNAVRQAYEKEGYTVYGAAISGKAAKELERGSGISSQTISLLGMRLEPSLWYELKHVAHQYIRAAKCKKTKSIDRLRLDKKTVLVIDEAGMVPTSIMAKLVEITEKNGSKLILSGEYNQLSPIQGASPLKAFKRELEYSELKKIRRQKSQIDQQVVRDFRSGSAKSALQSLSERGLVSVSKTKQKSIEKLVSDWSREVGEFPQKALIFCGTNKEREEINRQCQMEQSLCSRVNTTQGLKVNENYVFMGDRVLFTKNSYPLNVFNGDIGTVLSVNKRKKSLSIRKDDGQLIILPLKDYMHTHNEMKGKCALDLGYAVTTHKGQGVTVDRAFVLVGGTMQDREISYVQASRAREFTRLYTDELQAGEELTKLARQMEKSRAKDLAHDVIRENNENIQNLKRGLSR